MVSINGEKCAACQTFYDEKTAQHDITVFTEENLIGLDTYTLPWTIKSDREGIYGVAIDIGTTTLAFELLDMKQGAVLASYSVPNSQRAFGADVITRINRAVNGDADTLRKTVSKDILEGICYITDTARIDKNQVTHVTVVGNTTMLHLLRGFPCDGLGVYPFTPVSVDFARLKFGDVFDESDLNAELLILPGVSAFVGADITAGIIACGELFFSGTSLFIDLGTNGEMALFDENSKKFLVASSAAGPAFEGGSISMGVGSIPGAVASVKFLSEANVFIYETINNKPPLGICGTGVVDISAELIRHGFVDETGFLEKETDGDVIICPKSGIVFSQKDVREVQLAKSAVRSGLEILLEEANISYENVNKVFLAGGFGYKMDINSAAVIGLIPSELAEKVTAVGNAALGGARAVLLERFRESAIMELAASATEVSLSAHPRFSAMFMEYMNMGSDWA